MHASLKMLRDEMHNLQVIFEEDGRNCQESMLQLQSIAGNLVGVHQRALLAQSGAATPSTMMGLSLAASAQSSGVASPAAPLVSPTAAATAARPQAVLREALLRVNGGPS